MSDSVRYIHTQAQAQEELLRERRMAQQRYARLKRRKQDNSQNSSHDQPTPAEIEESSRIKKQKHADAMARIRQAQKEKNLQRSAKERADLLEKIHQRVNELDAAFCDLQVRETQWPMPTPDVKPMYKNCVTKIHSLACNIVCASCGCIYHNTSEFKCVPYSFEHLKLLQIPLDVDIAFDFSCGIEILDRNRILIDKLGITLDNQIRLCRRCYDQLSKARLPLESLANFRWVGTVPKQLNGLTWVEELLISRAHVCGSIIRLGQRNNPNAFLGIKGHCVFIPQDTTRLIDLLPISPSSLTEVVKVVWTGKSAPDKNQLQSRFSVRKNKVYDALKWLVDNHEDYKDNVTINETMVNDWDTEFVAVELLDSIGRVSDPSAEDACRDGFAIDDPDNDDSQDDLPLTSSGIVDTNNIAEIPDTTTLTRLAQLKDDITINVITGSKILNQYDCPTYFTSAFPCIFPYGTGKHLDARRQHKLPLLVWVTLLLRHSSRRFQGHSAFVISSFDISRMNHNLSKTNVVARQKNWPTTELLLASITPEQLFEAASQAERHQPITDPAVRELLKGVARVGSSAAGSDQRKSYMLAQLKSSIVQFGCPLIFITINPHERYSPLCLFYAGEKIDVKNFHPNLYSLASRLRMTLKNPLAVVEYFHTMVSAIIEHMLKGGMFGDVAHHYATIEYQGRGTPHTHLALWIKGASSPEKIREKAKVDLNFRQRLLDYMEMIASECLPGIADNDYMDIDNDIADVDDERQTDNNINERIFLPFPDPDAHDFERVMQKDVYHVIRLRQIHSRRHNPTCFKYGRKKCRFRFPRKLVSQTYLEEDTGIIYIQRNHKYVNNYNKWFSIITRGNHDAQILFVKNQTLAIIHYMMKYITKPEAALHSKLTVAAAVRKTMSTSPEPGTSADIAKRMLLKVNNKLDSLREVGVPEAISHLLKFPDHYTDATFVNIHTTALLRYMQSVAKQQYIEDADEDGFNTEIIVTDRGFCTVSPFDDYAYRGDALSGFCLYDYCAHVYKYKRLNGLPFDSPHPQHNHYTQFLRQETKTVPTLLGKLLFVKPDSENGSKVDEYYCLIAALFFPWSGKRSPKRSDQGWQEFVKANERQLSPRLRRYIYNLSLLHKTKEETRLHQLQLREQQEPDSHCGDFDDDSSSFTDTDESNSLTDDDDSEVDFSPDIDDIISNPMPEASLDFYAREGLDAWRDNEYLDSNASSPDRVLPPLADDDEFTGLSVEALQCQMKLLSEKAAAAHISQQLGEIFDSDMDDIQPDVFLSDASNEEAAIMRIVTRFTLNTAQQRAFRIIAYHSLGRSKVGPQLRMGVFGEAGTGKSRLIAAIRAWFSMHSRQEELLVTATTGSAAFNIRGATLHSTCNLPIGRKRKKLGQKKAKKLAACNYLIVDEVSMMDCKHLVNLHKNLGNAKGNEAENFGGLNIIFMGDFLQIPSVSNLHLYVDKPSEWALGHHLWRSLNAIVLLTEQMRQSEDPEFAAALHRFRIHQPTLQDIELLNSRVCAPLNAPSTIPIVVRRHKLRNAINSSKLRQASERSGVPIIHCLAKITERSKMSAAEAYRLKGGTSQLKGDAILSLIPGAPLLINQNIDSLLGLVNGAFVEFYGFADKDGVLIHDQIIRTLPAYMLIKLNHDVGVEISLPGLPPNVVGIEPTEDIKYRERNKSVSFTQFPISLAYAITDYKCQGQTFNWVIIDLKKPGGCSPSASPYVQLSRARTRQRLSILRPFSPDELLTPLPEELQLEIKWQEQKAIETQSLYAY